jgi:hypothetical protein
MTEIVLTEEQVRIVNQSRGQIALRTPTGDTVGMIDTEEAAILREWKARKTSPRTESKPVAHADVSAHLTALQAEWDRTGGFSPEYAVAFVRSLRTRAAA